MLSNQLQSLEMTLHYLYPLTVFVYYVVASTVAVCLLQSSSPHTRQRYIVGLLYLFITSLVVQAVLKCVELTWWHHWPTQDGLIGLLSCVLVFGIQQNNLSTSPEVIWYPYYGSWLLASIAELFHAVILFIEAEKVKQRIIDPSPDAENLSLFLRFDASSSLFRCVVAICALLAYHAWRNQPDVGHLDEERAPLILKPGQQLNGVEGGTDSGYGTNSDNTDTEATNTAAQNSPTDPESPWERKERLAREKRESRLKNEGSWFAYVKPFLIFLPYVWPAKSRRLQVYAALVALCLLSSNALNFLIPRQYGAVMDSLSGASDSNPWVQVAIFAALRLLSSEAGIPLIRHLLWIPVEFYCQETLHVAAYSHVMNLSSEFHDTQSSSDLIVAISHGDAVSNMLESVCFQALPMVIDFVVAFTYLSTIFGPYEGFITIATGLAFMQCASRIIASFRDQNRKVVKTYYEEHYLRQAGIQGWHTVSAFNQVPHEEARYGKAVTHHVDSVKALWSKSYVVYASQYLILLSGLIAGFFLAVYQITHGRATAGDFVMLLTYWAQLTSPLRFFSTLGRSLSKDLTHAERLLEVMTTKPTVVNKPDAKPLWLRGGKVEFRNVSFSYDKKKEILKGMKMTAPPGTTVAFVGATGAGKSTILKLLDRFYDVTGGSILIDSQDIRDITVSSLRQAVGIVPQAPILFDDTIMNNVRYARLSATDEEVYGACKAAAIHDQIMGFTEGYATRVGERGIKLSGGELQRVAIARAILKEPEIVLLDEATSAVDTDTEQKIQDGLRALCQGRTTLIVAHRLSTIMNADIIFVVSDGQVVEEGSHEDLIERKGKYADLWSKQIFVKPKDAKSDEDAVDPTQAQSSDNAQIDGSVDVATNGDVKKNRVSQDHSSPESKDAEIDDNVKGQAVQTPNGHRKEGSKLNPGAPEFTPRALAMIASKPVPISPLQNSWAEDVEDFEEVCARDEPVAADVESASISTTIKTHGVECEVIESHDTHDESDQLEVTTTPEARPRRNTVLSVSCPEQPLLSFPSPCRSVSQPVPTPPPYIASSVETTTPIKEVVEQTVSPVKQTQSSAQGEVTVRIEERHTLKHSAIPQPISRPPQGPSRGRGNPRGRTSRGRYRGSRGRRRPGNQNAERPPNSDTTVGSRSASRPSDPSTTSAQ